MTSARTTTFLTRTALLLALTLVFQVFARDLAIGIGLGTSQNFLVGPLVNLCLLVATGFAGIWAGVAIALFAPLAAFATGGLTEPVFLAVVAVGNLIYVLSFALAEQGTDANHIRTTLLSRIFGVMFGTLFKTVWLWGGVTLYVRYFPMKDPNSLVFAFSWPQMVTALIGGVLALLVLWWLEKSRPTRTSEESDS